MLSCYNRHIVTQLHIYRVQFDTDRRCHHHIFFLASDGHHNSILLSEGAVSLCPIGDLYTYRSGHHLYCTARDDIWPQGVCPLSLHDIGLADGHHGSHHIFHHISQSTQIKGNTSRSGSVLVLHSRTRFRHNHRANIGPLRTD